MVSIALENSLNEAFIRQFPDEAIRVIEHQSDEETIALLSNLPVLVCLDMLNRMTPIYAANIVGQLPQETSSVLFNQLKVNTSAKILAYFSEVEFARVLETLDPDVAEEIKVILNYPPDTAGYWMDPKVLGVHGSITVKQVLDIIDDQHRKGTRTLFIIDDEHRLTGAVTIQDLALADHDLTLSSLPKTPFSTVNAMEPSENIVDVFEQQKLSDLPVVDVDGKLLGVIRYSKFIDAIQADATAPLQTMVGVSKEEKALSSISFSIKKRLPWLQINLLTAFLAAATVGLFESTIQKYVALAVLLPVVAGQSGNTGAQALAVTMRGLALREIRTRQWKQVILKETLVALINGIGVAIICSLIVALWSKSLGLTIIIFVSMILSMVTAGLSGAVIPILLKKLGQDPAQSSTIILTTVTDVTGFFSFLAIATLLASLI